MIQCLRKRSRNKRGFTLMEVMVVVGIIAVIAGIAIPSVISMQKNMDHKQRCDYAKTIFLAAQSNLADLRSTGELDKLKDNAAQAALQIGDDADGSEIKTNFPAGDFASRYAYTYHDPMAHTVLNTPAAYYDTVLPVNSVETVIRDKQVIIEYNPRTGSVYSVFYSEDYSRMVEKYQSHALQRNEEWCKENLIGYYNGSDLGNADLPFIEADSKMSFVNDQEALLNIEIGLQGLKQDGSSENLFDQTGVDAYVKGLEMNLTVIGETGGMFTTTIKKANESVVFDRTIDGKYIVWSVPFDSLVAEGSFTQIHDNVNGQGFYVQPGDNVSLTLEVKFISDSENAPVIVFDDCVLAGINPLFHSLTGDSQNGYTIAISNGRHLQNLNAVAADIAKNVSAITFVNEEKKPEDTNKTEEDVSKGQEAGTNAGTKSSSANTAETLEVNWKDTTSYYMEKHPGSNVTYFAPISNAGLFDVNQRGSNNTLTIDGQDVVIRNLRIKDSQTSANDYVNPYGADNADVGLFRYVSGNVNNLRIVNPVIQGGDNSFAVGALAGSADEHTTVNGCYVYVDTKADDFIWNNLDISANFDGSSELKYGVSGYTSVGGMVGCSKGAAFEECLAAVPVYGHMGNASGIYVGVGGFVGSASSGSFSKCYSSVQTTGSGSYSGNAACGIGGFVGTSNETRFYNCFASGNVTNSGLNSLDACGGFVGVTQNTNGQGVFSSCYAAGTVTGGATFRAKFVGKNTSYNVDGCQELYERIVRNQSSTNYIYSGCFYMQGYGKSLNDDDCALPADAQLLQSLQSIATKECEGYVLNALRVRYDNLDNISNLESTLRASGYAQGNIWVSGTNSVTNTYTSGNNTRYPYAMLKGMPFYGTWQDTPSEVRMIYWESYGTADDDTGYHVSNNSMTLQNKTVYEDGYMLISALGGSTYTVEIDGQEKEVEFKNKNTFNGKTYYYGVLPNTIAASESYYTEVIMHDGSNKYTMYFNPNVAMSQINPAQGMGTTATNPGKNPVGPVVIRSPRQLAALGSDAMKPFLNNEFILSGNIDFTQSNYSLPNLGAFSGTLTGDATITVKNMETGLIDTLNGGKVEGITLNVTNGITLEDGEGALVNTMNSGTLSGCKVKASVSGADNAGLVVGSLNGGTISDCHFEGTNSSSLGFVGTAKKLDGSKAIVGNPNYVCSDKVNDGKYTLSDITGRGLSEIETGETLYKQEYAATITSDCKINGTPAVTGKYYYSITGENTYEWVQENAIEVENIGKTAISEFEAKASEWTKYPYYVQVDGNLHPLYVKVEVEQVEITAPALVSELDGADQGKPGLDNDTDPDGSDDTESDGGDSGSGGDGGTDASQPSETPTVPTPQYETVYTYSFSLDNGETLWMEPVKTKDRDTQTTFELYRVHVLTSGDYVLFTERYNPLSAVPVTNFDGTITANMIWTLKDGILINMQDDTVSVKPELVLPVNKNKVTVNVNGTEYTMHTVSEVETRDVKLVDSDVIYSTTKRDAEPSVPTDGTDASGSGT